MNLKVQGASNESVERERRMSCVSITGEPRFTSMGPLTRDIYTNHFETSGWKFLQHRIEKNESQFPKLERCIGQVRVQVDS